MSVFVPSFWANITKKNSSGASINKFVLRHVCDMLVVVVHLANKLTVVLS